MQSRSLLVIGVHAIALLLPASAGAACIVLDGGATVEVRTAPERRGALVVFQDRNGRLTSLQAAEVDLAATDEANRRGVCGENAPSREVAPPQRASPWRDTARPVAIEAPTGLGVQAFSAHHAAEVKRWVAFLTEIGLRK